MDEYVEKDVSLGKKFFKYRDYTPLPLLVLVLIFAKPTVVSATIGMLMIFFGEMIRFYSVSFIGLASRIRSDNTGAKLVQEGPFGMVRNPLYVGNFFISTGLATYSGSIFMYVLTIVLFSVQYYFIVKYEEANLTKIFGQEYKSYCERVSAWIPSFKGVSLGSFSMTPYKTLRQTFTSEKKTLLAIGAILILLILRS